MPTLSAAQTAALGLGPRPWLCEIALPGSGTVAANTWYVAKIGYASRGYGAVQYRPLVLDFDYPRYGPGDSNGSLAGVEMSITIDDNSRELVAITEGRYADQVEGCTVLIREAHETLTTVEWLPIFSGVVIGVDWDGTKATIRCRTDDAPIKHDSPKPYARITVDSFTAADPTAWNTIARPIYGEHNSAGYTDHGMISCPSVDRANYIYMVSIGRCLDVSAVFIDDTRMTLTTHYTWGYLSRRGIWYTVIYILAAGYSAVFGASWSGGSTAEKLVLSNGARITADVLGYESTGYGAGATGSTGLIANPVDQLAHYLSNFVFGGWRRGAWLATHARVASFTTLHTFFEDRTYKGARVIDSSKPASSEIASWLTSMECVGWWTPSGTLAFGVDDFTDTNVYPTGPISLQEKLLLSKQDDQLKVANTKVEFVHDDHNSQYLASLTVEDPDATTEAADNIQQEWGSAK